jgi:hypothetical protein
MRREQSRRHDEAQREYGEHQERWKPNGASAQTSRSSATPKHRPIDSDEAVAALNLEKFLAMNFPVREKMLSPWLPVQGLALVHSFRGVGKTHFGIGVAWALANGGGFLRWSCPDNKAWKVLLIDGEMPAGDLQERLRQVQDRSQFDLADPDYLKIAAADTKRNGLPDVVTSSFMTIS